MLEQRASYFELQARYFQGVPMANAQINAVKDHFKLQNRNAISHVIRTAVSLGILESLREGQKSGKQLAELLDLDQHALLLLMEVLRQSELVEKYGEDYALSSVGRMIPKELMDFGDRYWTNLEGFVRSGIPLPRNNAVRGTESDFLATSAAGEWMRTPAALDTAKALDIGRSRRALRILEIGCGTGVFGVTLVHRDPDSRLTLLDNADGLARAETTVKSLALESRVVLVEGDYLNLNLDSDAYDLVLATGLVHRHSPKECEQLFRNVHSVLKPQGEFGVVDIFPGQQQGDLNRAILALEIGLRTTHGRLHSPDAFQHAMVMNGFDQIRYAHLPSPPNIWGLILGLRD